MGPPGPSRCARPEKLACSPTAIGALSKLTDISTPARHPTLPELTYIRCQPSSPKPTRPPRTMRHRSWPQPDTSPTPTSHHGLGGRSPASAIGPADATSQHAGTRAWPWTALLLGLAASPTGAALAVWQQVGDAGLAFKIAVLVAAIALPVSVAVVFQDTLHTWLQHRPEMRRARDDSRALRATTTAALASPHDTPSEAAHKRADARDRGWTNPTTLGDMMAITRHRAAPLACPDEPGR
jgi:hypothetical protein